MYKTNINILHKIIQTNFHHGIIDKYVYVIEEKFLIIYEYK